MKQLSTLPLGELIPAKPAVPVNVTQAQTIGYFLIIFPPRVTDSFIWTVSHLVIKEGQVPTILNSLLAVGCLYTFENVPVSPSLLPWCFCCCPDWRWLHQLWSPWPPQLPGGGKSSPGTCAKNSGCNKMYNCSKIFCSIYLRKDKEYSDLHFCESDPRGLIANVQFLI